MFWPPRFVSNNHVVVSDAKQFATDGTSRFDEYVQPACVLAPWLARTDQDTAWPAADPLMRIMLIGEPTHAIRSANADTIGSIVQLGFVGAGTQLWEVVSFFDWYVDDDAGKVGCVAWCRLYVPADMPPVALLGGDSPFSPRLISPSVDTLLSVPAGTTAWYYTTLISPVGYSLDVSGLPGTAAVSTYGGPPGSLTDDIIDAVDGTTTQSEPSSVGPVRYIKVVGDPSTDTNFTFNVSPSTPSWIEGGTSDSIAVAISSGVDEPLLVRAGATVYYTVPLASPTGYSIVVSGLDGSATVETDGGSPGSLTTDIAATGNGAWTQTAPSSSGANRYVVLVGDPHVDSLVTFDLTPTVPPGGSCADPISSAVLGSPLSVTVPFGETVWVLIPGGANALHAAITSSVGASDTLVTALIGNCSSHTDRSSIGFGSGGSGDMGVDTAFIVRLSDTSSDPTSSNTFALTFST